MIIRDRYLRGAAVGAAVGRREVSQLRKKLKELLEDEVDDYIEGWRREVSLGPKDDRRED